MRMKSPVMKSWTREETAERKVWSAPKKDVLVGRELVDGIATRS